MTFPGVSPHRRAVGRQRCALSLGALLHGQQLWVLSFCPLDTARAGGDSRDKTALLAAWHCQSVFAKLTLDRLPRNGPALGGCPVSSSGAGRSWMMLLLLLCPGHAPSTSTAGQARQ